MHIRLPILTILVFDFSATCHAESKLLGGVWTGSLGKVAVTACFNDKSRDANYYYQKHLISIALTADGASVVNGMVMHWKEADGLWNFDDVSNEEIHGTWVSNDKSRVLPVYLKRITAYAANQNYDPINQACGTSEFNLPLEHPRTPLLGPVHEVNGLRFRKVTVGLEEALFGMHQGRETNLVTVGAESSFHITSMVVLGNSPSVSALNDVLRKLLPLDEMTVAGMFNARREILAWGTGGGYSRDVQEVSVVSHWLSLKTSENASGGARSVEVSENRYTFNIRTGQPESLLAWFNGGESMEGSSPTELPPPLAEFVHSRIGKGDPRSHLSREEFDECYSAPSPGSVQYNLGLSEGKMLFEVPLRHGGACGETIEIPFAELKPYLNKQGTKALAEIILSPTK
jgi:hypothetical protein